MMLDDKQLIKEFGTEEYYCQTCNCHSLGYYQNELCPVCGEKMIRMRYVITETKDGGKCTIKIKPQMT